MEKISVVIPTRNRKESLLRTLAALSNQRAVIHEVIVVDSSDSPIAFPELVKFEFKACFLFRAKASVCAQRNEGVRRATGNLILVLDDDISLQENYISLCLNFIEIHPKALIISGLVVERNNSGNWAYKAAPISFFKLVWLFIFQLSIWTDLDTIKKSRFNAFLLKHLQRYYNRLGNGISKGGWPVLSCFSKPFFRSQIYYLGASLIKRDWLLANLYSEKLDQHGIGDNYGLAVKLLPEQGVFVLTDTYAYHHKMADNRLDTTTAYYNRVLALDYFSTIHGSASRNWLIWSLLGNLVSAAIYFQWNQVAKNCKLIWILLRGRNPLLQ